MDLILKLPENKPPFIGVLFDSEYQSWLNRYLVESNDDCEYTIILEVSGDMINLILKKPGIYYKYEGLRYLPKELKNFLLQTQKSECFNFSHLLMKNRKLSVVKFPVSNKYFILKILEIKFIPEDKEITF